MFLYDSELQALPVGDLIAISNCPRFWVSRVRVISACSTYLIFGQFACKTNCFCSPSLIDNSSLSNEIHSVEKIPKQIFEIV